MASCKACVVMDDELNILPISSHVMSIAPVAVREVTLDAVTLLLVFLSLNLFFIVI